MRGICNGRVVIITGAGRGIGREHALAFAREGARVVVNDLGAEPDGEGRSDGPAGEVVELIRELGGEAVANGADVTDFEATGRMVADAIERWGTVDVVVNNAGFVRDRMFVSTSEEEWDAVISVHLKGHFCTSRHAAAHWRERAKAGQRAAERDFQGGRTRASHDRLLHHRGIGRLRRLDRAPAEGDPGQHHEKHHRPAQHQAGQGDATTPTGGAREAVQSLTHPPNFRTAAGSGIFRACTDRSWAPVSATAARAARAPRA